MGTLLADSPSVAESERQAPAGLPVEAQTPPPSPDARTCAGCSAPMAAGQDWCLQCGAGASAGDGARRWGPATTILAVTALLALGAAAAAYAALSRKAPRSPVLTTTVAQVTPPATTPPAVTPANPGTPTTVTPLLPTTKAKPPKIPLQTPTPKATTPATPPVTTETPSSTTTTSTSTTPSTTNTGGANTEPQPILLDTNAASTYDPYAYPASDFGDPSLTIDGDTSTGWTAIVKPETAPKMAEGVLIELKTPRRLSALKLVTTTPGMRVQVYGATGKTVPTSITDPAWTTLSHSMVIHKRHARIALDKPKRSFTFLALWISAAPAGATRVTVNELELLPVR